MNEKHHRETYIAPIAIHVLPNGTFEERLALTKEFWKLHDFLYERLLEKEELDRLQKNGSVNS